MKNHVNLFLFAFIILTLFSCAPTKTVVDTSCPGYKSVDFKREDISAYKLGIMPVLGGDAKEQFRRPMGDALTSEMRKVLGDTIVLSPYQVTDILNSNGLSSDYARAINDYHTSGILDKNLLRSIGKALDTKFLLYTTLLEEQGRTADDLWPIVELYVQCQVWDTQRGDVVWEGKGGCAKVTTDQSDLALNTARGLAAVVGNNVNEGPCEDPDLY